MQSTFDERNWLAWLVRVRILILTFLLGIQLAVAQLTPARLPLRLFISTILLWFTVSLFYVVLLSFWQEHRLQASLQVLTDLIMVSLVVHETGAWDSSFNFLYPLAIIVAGILLPRVWAYLVAALAFILYGTVLELNYYGVVRSYCTTHPELKALQGIIFVNLFAFLAIACGSAYGGQPGPDFRVGPSPRRGSASACTRQDGPVWSIRHSAAIRR